MPDLIDVSTAAALCGVTERAIRYRITRGVEPWSDAAQKCGGVYVIPRSIVEQHTNKKSPDQEDPAGAKVC